MALTDEIQKHIPNYAELFGQADICECQHCNSVYSPASYLVDIMRFLDKSTTNKETPIAKSPLAKLLERRPDLEHLPFTCENTNTIIPYIDLGNEIMESYVNFLVEQRKDPPNIISSVIAHDTGDATAAELRANPQFTTMAAYEEIKKAVFPFTLPYHQPLDVIRTFLSHLKTSRAELMEAFQTDGSDATTIAIAAEYLKLSQEEYQTLTDKDFNTADIGKPLWEYYGYDTEASSKIIEEIIVEHNTVTITEHAENRVLVTELLSRTGVKYVDLVELIKTKFINPHQDLLEYLESLFTGVIFSEQSLYGILQDINNNLPVPEILIDSLNANLLTVEEFTDWVHSNFDNLQKVITLFEPASRCELATTIIRSLEKIADTSVDETEIIDSTLIKLHRFIRLWRKSGWTIHELDVIIVAMAEPDITPNLIIKLSWVEKIALQLNIPLIQIATMWGEIDTYGNKSLYSKLFLNKAVQSIDVSFFPDPFGQFLTNESEEPDPVFLSDHKPAIFAAFRMDDEQFNEIIADSNIDINNAILNLQNLSIFYRYTVLSKALKISISELCLIKRLFPINPFSEWHIEDEKFININPEETYKFIQLVQKIKESGFTVAQLQYILTGEDLYNTLAIPSEKVQQTIRAIRDGFALIEQEHPELAPEAITEELIRSKMTLIFSPEITEQFIAMLNGKILYTTIVTDNLGIADEIETAFIGEITYTEGSGRLQSLGVMTDVEKVGLLNLSSDGSFQAGVQEIYNKPDQFIIDNLYGVFNGDILNGSITTADAIKIFLDHPAQPVTLEPAEKLVEFYKYFLPFLKKRLRSNTVIQNIAALIALEESVVSILLQSQADDVIKSLSLAGLSAEYFAGTTFTPPAVVRRIDPQIDFEWENNPPDTENEPPLIPADGFSSQWNGFICAPSSAEYTIIAEVEESDETVALFIDGQQMTPKLEGETVLSKEILFSMTAGNMYSVKLTYTETTQEAGIRLYWKTPELPKEIIPSEYLYPATEVENFVNNISKWHRAAIFINGFQLNASEVEHLINFKIDFGSTADGDFDFNAIKSSHWLRIYEYTFLKKQLPITNLPLIDLFREANKTSPLPDINATLLPLAANITGWSLEYLSYLSTTTFSFTVSDYENETSLIKLQNVLSLAKKTGASVELLANWSVNQTDFSELDKIAQSIKNTVKAKYEEEDWLEVAKNLSNKIRENQRDALISYLLVQKLIVTWGAVDADSLFEYFLIDVQMGACMDTSRIKQAISSVQLFVSRCLLNLESSLNDEEDQIGVAPDYIDEQWVNWMKNYRVWEVNRKIFVYPENWLEPELRDDKSPFFKELESELLQNDITDRTVEDAFRNYLNKLDEVAYLDVCGMYLDTETQILHVFARTNASPNKYYYRRMDELNHWTAWEKVQLDIRGIEDGIDSGVHLLPIIWKGRLFLFWLEFIIKPKIPDPVTKKLEDSITVEEPNKYWEIQLAWSEYYNSKWTPKQLSKEFITEEDANFKNARLYKLFLYVDSKTQELNVTISKENLEYKQSFIISDIKSKFYILKEDKFLTSLAYSNHFIKRTAISQLILKENTYLNISQDHKILSTQLSSFEHLEHPFFYQDIKRTYYAEPVDITIREKAELVMIAPELSKVVIAEAAIDIWVTDYDRKTNAGLGEEMKNKIPEGKFN